MNKLPKIIPIKCTLVNSDNPTDQVLGCLDILEKINTNLHKDNVINLDMSDLDWITPFCALILSNKISQAEMNEYKIIIGEPKNSKVSNYLLNLGFPMGRKGFGGTYIPIYHFSENTNKATSDIFKIINETFPNTAKGNAIKYLISELADNIDQHSRFSHASIMAQYFEKKQYIDIGVMDNGISIPRNFENNKIAFDNDADALNKAIQGVSTKKDEGRGTGLYSSQKIVKEGLKGEFYIISRNGLLVDSYNYSRKLYKLQNYSLNGTLCYIRFKVPKVEVSPYKFLEE